jgi:hypothetical protein
VRARQSLSLDGRAPPALDTGRLIGRRVLLAEDNLINQVRVVTPCVTNTIQMLSSVAAGQQGQPCRILHDPT